MHEVEVHGEAEVVVGVAVQRLAVFQVVEGQELGGGGSGVPWLVGGPIDLKVLVVIVHDGGEVLGRIVDVVALAVLVEQVVEPVRAETIPSPSLTALGLNR